VTTEAADAPRAFPVGARVRVSPECGLGHVRTPGYVRGRHGHVLRCHGTFPDPGDLASSRPARLRRLYTVAFAASELWSGASGWVVQVDLYEHWLSVVRKETDSDH
jgi:nitrile hydratase subunit beta